MTHDQLRSAALLAATARGHTFDRRSIWYRALPGERQLNCTGCDRYVAYEERTGRVFGECCDADCDRCSVVTGVPQ